MLTIRVHSDKHIEITGIDPDCRITTTADTLTESIVPGLYRYRGDDKRVVAFSEGTWFQIQRSSDGANDFFALPVPPRRAEIDVLPDHESTQEQLALFELACKLSEQGNEVWIDDEDMFYKATSGRVFRLRQSGVVRLEAVLEVPAGARLTLVADPLIDELCNTADEIDGMLEEPRRTPRPGWSAARPAPTPASPSAETPASPAASPTSNPASAEIDE